MSEKNNIVYLAEHFMRKSETEMPSNHAIEQFNYHCNSSVQHVTDLLRNIKTMYNSHAFSDALIRAILTQAMRDALNVDITFKNVVEETDKSFFK